MYLRIDYVKNARYVDTLVKSGHRSSTHLVNMMKLDIKSVLKVGSILDIRLCLNA